jgi:hypothetical protein
MLGYDEHPVRIVSWPVMAKETGPDRGIQAMGPNRAIRRSKVVVKAGKDNF